MDQFSAQTQAGPEGGRNAGGTVNLTLRAGTNSLHGSVYYFNRNELFGAKSPFSSTKQKVRNFNTGFSVGGPFLKDKLFGFLTFEHQRFAIGESGTATEPSVGYQAQAKALLAANGIAVSPVMQSVLNTLYGTGVLGQDTVGVQDNYHSSDPEFGYSWNGLAKVDYRLSEKDNISVHWFVGQGNQVAPVGSQLLSFYEVAPIHVQNIAIVYNRLISSHISNQILAGVNYFNQVFDDYNSAFNVQSLGFITGAGFTNAPNINIGSFDPAGLTPPEGRNDITGHLTDQLSWVIGKHQMRFGGEYRQAQLDEFYHRHSVGSFTFDGSNIASKINAKLPGCNTVPQTATNCFSADGYIAPLADFPSGPDVGCDDCHRRSGATGICEHVVSERGRQLAGVTEAERQLRRALRLRGPAAQRKQEHVGVSSGADVDGWAGAAGSADELALPAVLQEHQPACRLELRAGRQDGASRGVRLVL